MMQILGWADFRKVYSIINSVSLCNPYDLAWSVFEAKLKQMSESRGSKPATDN